MPVSAASGADSAAQSRRLRPARRAPSATAIVPATGPHAPVERELAEAAVLEQLRRGQLVVAGEHGERDRKVEPGALLAQRGGREVDGDLRLARPREHRVDDAAVDAMLRLLAGAVGEPDDRERRQVGADEVRLYLDAARLEADDGSGEGACEHATDARRKAMPCLCRLRAGTPASG